MHPLWLNSWLKSASLISGSPLTKIVVTGAAMIEGRMEGDGRDGGGVFGWIRLRPSTHNGAVKLPRSLAGCGVCAA